MKKRKLSLKNLTAIIVFAFTIILSLSAGIVGVLATINEEILVILSNQYLEDTSGNYKCYKLNDSDISIAWNKDVSATGNDSWTVPETLDIEEVENNQTVTNTYTVKKIADGGFRGCAFSTISLPSSIVEIGSEAFAYCTNLTEFYLPQFITEIKPSTFLDCRSLEAVHFSSYQYVSFGTDSPDNTIGGDYYILEGNNNSRTLYEKSWDDMTSLSIIVSADADNINSITRTTELYYYNTTTKHLYVYDENANPAAWVRESSASRGSANPSSATTSYYVKTVDSVTNIYKKKWTSLNANSVTFSSRNPNNQDTTSYFVNTDTYRVYKIVNNSYVNQSGTYTKTSSNKKITTIGDHAFDSCVSLKSFHCPDNVTVFGECCFQKCTSLTAFNFPTPKSGAAANIIINYYAFAYCESLNTVFLESNILRIYNYAFVHCSETLSFDFTGKKSDYKHGLSDNEMFYFDGKHASNHGPNENNCIYWRNKKIGTNYISSGSDITHKYPVTDKVASTIAADSYPGLRYIITQDESKLDSASTNSTSVVVVDNGEKYAVIKKFVTPSVYVDGYFEQVTRTEGNETNTYNQLTIPEELDGYPVKIIDESVFENNTDIDIVVFSENLVQIKHKAFYKCTNIRELNFTACKNLIEISYMVFTDNTKNGNTNPAPVLNQKVTSLVFPKCLEYLGDCAFAYFQKVNELVFLGADDNTASLKVIGDSAFYRLGYDYGNNGDGINLVLPNSLNDQDTALANMKRFKSPAGYDHDNANYRYCAIGKYAFDGAVVLRTVTMAKDSTHKYNANNEPDLTYTCSLYSNAFTRCSNLVRFQANTNVKTIGNDCFKGCSSLYEVFLSSFKVDSSAPYPWAVSDGGNTYGGALFSGICPNLVIYIDGDKAPGQLDEMTIFGLEPTTSYNLALGHFWNSENGESYINELNLKTGTGSMKDFARSHIATFYNINFEDNNGLFYWNLSNTNSPAGTKRQEPPTKKSQYDAGIVVLADHGTKDIVTNNNTKTYHTYTVARYFTNNTTNNASDLVDLTGINGFDYENNLITVIGDEAFARSALFTSGKPAGRYFVLPKSIEKIGERAFYRRTGVAYNASSTPNPETYNGQFGVRIVTFRKTVTANNTSTEQIVQANRTDTYATDALFNTAISSAFPTSNPDYTTFKGYCCLPDGVEFIGRNAFYNNIFETVKIGTGLNFLGNSAFYVHPYIGNNLRVTRAKISSITIDSSSYFTVDATTGGVYYTGGGADKKMLVYQPADDSTTSLSIASGTTAIGMHACTNTSYQTITLPTSLTTIYGGGFQKNLNLKEVKGTNSGGFSNNLRNLQYIGAMENANGGPSSATANDYYIDLMDYTLYVKANNTWSNVDFTNVKHGSSTDDWTSEEIAAAVAAGETIYYIYDSNNHVKVYNESSWGSDITAVSTSNEIWDYSVSQHFDNIDYRDYAFAKRGIIECLYGAFAGCDKLATLDFTQMTGLKKIGYGAFSGDKALVSMTGGTAYSYYAYEEGSVVPYKIGNLAQTNLTSKVLDLRDCSSLVSINQSAFEGCSNIQYAHLPDNKPNGATESNIYIGYDPNTSIYKQGYNIFSNNATRILVGETVYYADYSTYGKTKNAGNHYKSGWYQASNLVFYYAASDSDVPENDTTCKYWTYGDTTQDFILFFSSSDARAYL